MFRNAQLRSDEHHILFVRLSKMYRKKRTVATYGANCCGCVCRSFQAPKKEIDQFKCIVILNTLSWRQVWRRLATADRRLRDLSLIELILNRRQLPKAEPPPIPITLATTITAATTTAMEMEAPIRKIEDNRTPKTRVKKLYVAELILMYGSFYGSSSKVLLRFRI